MEKIDPLKRVFFDTFAVKNEVKNILNLENECQQTGTETIEQKFQKQKKLVLGALKDEFVNITNELKFSIDIFHNSVGFGTEIEIEHELSSTSLFVQVWVKYFNENKLYNDDICLSIIDSDNIRINLTTVENIEYIRVVGVKI